MLFYRLGVACRAYGPRGRRAVPVSLSTTAHGVITLHPPFPRKLALRAAGLGLLLLAAFVSCGRPNATVADAGSPPHVAMVRRFVTAFNTGDAERLGRLLAELYSPSFFASFGDTAAAGAVRLDLFRTYGPLAISHVDTTASPPIVWSRGIVSGGWVGHQLYLDDSTQKAVRHTTWRARPVPYPARELTAALVADSMREYLDRLARAGLFSGSVVLSRNGQRYVSHSWGSNGQLNPSPVTDQTRFHTASITKMLTVTAFLQLVQAGRVDLMDPIGKWIPEYPAPYRDSVLIRHLLTHTSGIELDDNAEYLGDIRVARNASGLLAAQIRYIAEQRPRFASGSEYDYTSEGIDLLGVIIERATGRPWTQVVDTSVLKPAGMTATRFSVPRDEGDWALGRTSLTGDLETASAGELRSALEVLPAVAKPSSGVWSTAEDLHRFMRALLDHRLLSAAWTDSLLTPKLETGDLPKYGIEAWVGLGAQGEDLWDVRTVGHGGVVPGYSGAIEYLPGNGWLLTVLSNTGEATGFLVFQRFLELAGHAR